MDYSPVSPVYASEEYNMSCPSTPRPMRRKPRITFENGNIVVPLSHIGQAPQRIPVASFPKLPFTFADETPSTDDAAASESSNQVALPPPPLTANKNDKLSSPARKQTLAHLNRRRRSLGARCA